jgi:hypothetical protein
MKGSYIDIAVKALDCEFEGTQTANVDGIEFEMIFTPDTGACVFACTAKFNDEIGYCCTYESDCNDYIDCVVDCLNQLEI